MKKFWVLFVILFSCLSLSATSLVYAPYYMARGTMKNGKVKWEKYVSIRSSSIFVSSKELEINIMGESTKFYGFQKKSRGQTKNGGEYIFYQGLKSQNGRYLNVRIDFTNDWVIFSLYPKGSCECYKFKCKYLTEY